MIKKIYAVGLIVLSWSVIKVQSVDIKELSYGMPTAFGAYCTGQTAAGLYAVTPMLKEYYKGGQAFSTSFLNQEYDLRTALGNDIKVQMIEGQINALKSKIMPGSYRAMGFETTVDVLKKTGRLNTSYISQDESKAFVKELSYLFRQNQTKFKGALKGLAIGVYGYHQLNKAM